MSNMNVKSLLTNACCPKCGQQLKTSDIKGYGFLCENCDENFYTIEVKVPHGELSTISIKMSSEQFTKLLHELNNLCSKYGCSFLGHDDEMDYTDFGWEDGFPESQIMNDFTEELESLIKR